MRLLFLLLPAIIFIAYALTPTPLSTLASYPTLTLYPSLKLYPTFEPAGAEFLEALQAGVESDDSIPLVGQQSIIALIVGQPTYVFIENPGFVLQFNVVLPQTEEEIKKTAGLLSGKSVSVTGEYGTPLTRIEVSSFTRQSKNYGSRWSFAHLWNAEDMRPTPLDPELGA